MPAFDEDHFFSLIPPGRVFLTYLKANPDQADRLRNAAISIYGHIKNMDVPFNEACIDLVMKSLQIEAGSSHSKETSNRFTLLTKLDQYGEQLTPQELDESQRECDALKEEMDEKGVFNFAGGDPKKLAEKLANHFTEQAKNTSQGLGQETQKALSDYISYNHLEMLATIASEAAGDALLDEQAKNEMTERVEFMHEYGGDKKKILQTSYTLFVHEMNIYASYVVRDHLDKFLKSERDWKSGRREITPTDVQNLFKNQPN